MSTLTVAVAQMAVRRGEVKSNLAKAESLLTQAAAKGAQLVCLPEMWTTGFDWQKINQMADRLEADVASVAEMARRHGVWINGSMAMKNAAGNIANTSILFSPEGRRVGIYRKMHLFSLFHEHQHMAAGDEPVAIETPWGKVGLAICYDLRFPELFRHYAIGGVQIQLCPAAWPVARLAHWQTLLRARAIENQTFLIAANQVGTEDFGVDGQVTYCGHSAIIDPWGEIVADADGAEETLLISTIDLTEVDRVRQKIPVLRDRRPGLYGPL